MSRRSDAASNAARGGRAPGSWTLVTPDELRQFRADHSLSRARLAQQVGVSTTSVQNWESGRVASLRIQRRLRALIDQGTVPADGHAPEAAQAEALREATIRTTGAIVAAYVQSQRGLKPADLPDLVRQVRDALNG